MNLVEVLLSTIGAGLRIWDKKLSNKYFDEWRDLTTELRDLDARPYSARDQSRIDEIEFKLFQLSSKIKAEMEAHEVK